MLANHVYGNPTTTINVYFPDGVPVWGIFVLVGFLVSLWITQKRKR